MSESLIAEKNSHICPMCLEKAFLFSAINNRNYYKCNRCYGIFLDPRNRLSIEEEKEHYEEHKNDVYDKRYREFVSPITKLIMNEYSTTAIGLDFGAGTGPVISKVLQEKGYSINQYDPIFITDQSVLNLKYDFIVCCEVIEHFYKPLEEFQLLFQLLKDGGKLVCMTDLVNDGHNFNEWYYKNDPTHVFFYSAKTVDWVHEKLKFSDVSIENRMIVFTK